MCSSNQGWDFVSEVVNLSQIVILDALHIDEMAYDCCIQISRVLRLRIFQVKQTPEY